jgi:uncharacterized repeat protein (TIGR01451 family)
VIDPAVTKLGSPSLALVGDTVVFTLNVFNNGDTDADNVIVTDVVPGFLTINSVVIAPPGPTFGIVGNTITMDFGTLPPTDFSTVPPTNFFTVTITTTVNSSATPPGGTNNVTLTTDSLDEDLTNNFDSAPIGIVAELPETGCRKPDSRRGRSRPSIRSLNR